jgi:PAS domain S-box-containing protein
LQLEWRLRPCPKSSTTRKPGHSPPKFSYRQLIEATDLALYTTDAKGHILFFNQAAATLWGREPVVGQDLWCGSWRIFTLDGSPLPHDECPMATAIKEDRTIRGVEIVVEQPGGRRATILPYPTPLHDASGKLVGAVNLLVDISARHGVEATRRHAGEIEDEFLGLVSHELRTPIATVLGNAIMLSRRAQLLSDEDKSQALADIVSAGEKLQRIIENLLLLTRMEAGAVEALEPVLPSAAIAAAVESFRERAPSRHIAVALEPGLPIVSGQPALLSLVLENLLGNADRYSPPEAPIMMLARQNDAGQVEICVRDFGLGLEQTEIEKVFTPFYRSARVRALTKGMGLGLAVSKRAIEAQHGRIWAVNRPDGGSDFVFSLQVLPGETQR